MDRILVYPYEQPTDAMFLNTNQNTMVGLGFLAQAVLGAGTVIDGLACTPTSPATMSVLVGPGSLYSVQSLEATAYGSLAADTADQIVKQGIVLGNTTFGCPAPSASGQSVVYLVEAQYQDVDSGSTTLNYYDAANPAVSWTGPNNTGTPQNTVRKGVCALALKTGVAATTGSQVTPTPDAGYTGLWAITVANSATTITSGNIAQLATAPFISPKLAAMPSYIQAGATNYAADTSGAANTITVALTPAPAALTTGMKVKVKVANANTGATVMNTNGLGNVAVHTTAGAALVTGTLSANGVYDFIYDGASWQVQGAGAFAARGVNSDITVLSGLGGSIIQQGGDGRLDLQNNTGVYCVNLAGTAAVPITASSLLSTASQLLLQNNTLINCVNLAGTSAVPVNVGAASTLANATALGQFLASAALNGYMEVPCWTGSALVTLIIQWGGVTISAGANTLQTVTLPVAFPNAVLQVFGSSASTGNYAGAVTNGLSSLKVFSLSNAALVAWLAIGY